MILLCLFQESKHIIFTCGDSQEPLVIFSVPTRENNVFTLLPLHAHTTFDHTMCPADNATAGSWAGVGLVN
jgi:hypothetical protein